MRKRSILWVLLAATIAMGAWIVIALPAAQDMQASSTLLLLSIAEFIEAHGRMPTGIEELTTAGHLRKLPNGWYTSVATGKTINRMEDIQVDWTFDRNACKVVEGELRSIVSGERTYIIRPRRFLLPGQWKSAMNSSVIIFERLKKAS